MKKTIFLLVLLAASLAFAGSLVDGLQETNEFLTGTLVPLISVLGLIVAGINFYFGYGPEAVKKSAYILVGSIIIYSAGFLIETIQHYFGD